MIDIAHFSNHSIDDLIEIIRMGANSRVPPRGKSSKEMWRRRLIAEVLNLYGGSNKGAWTGNVNYNQKGNNQIENELINIRGKIALMNNIPIESVPTFTKLWLA